ncbi:ParA family protein [Streptomyces sp. HUAS TT7]|uniref:ParA family protein n=1 Tax=Streptomyces sp. HUAS TT7 TaxID=3447507 RepID=UPI003F65768E
MRDRTKKITYVNQKGGVGKSLFSLFASASAAEEGARVLLRDLDPQANVTMALALQEVEFTMNDLLKPNDDGEVVEGALASAIRPAGKQWPNGLYGVAADLALAAREGDAGPEVQVPRERRLQIVSEGATDAFDLVATDCPPSVGQLTINALIDSDVVFIVTAPELWPIQGVHQAVRTIKRVQKYYNPDLEFGGIYINRYYEGRVESTARTQELRDQYGDLVKEPIVPDIEAIRRAVGAITPLSAYGPEAKPAAQLFRQIATEHLKS